MLLESWELDWGNVGWSFLQIQIAQALLRSWSLNLKCKDFTGDGKSLISGISLSVQFRSGEHRKTTTITFFPQKKPIFDVLVDHHLFLGGSTNKITLSQVLPIVGGRLPDVLANLEGRAP